jgi:rhodanese-related sulfurtransferase
MRTTKHAVLLALGLGVALWACRSAPKQSVTASAPAPARSGPEAPRAEGDRLAELVDSDAYLLLDVRSPEEIAELGTVEGYLNIPIEELAERLDEVPRDRPILTGCNGGNRAARAAALLEANGFGVVAYCGLRDYEGPRIHPKADDEAQ